MSVSTFPQIKAENFDKALTAWRKVLGDEWVLASEVDKHTYRDAFSPGHDDNFLPSAAIAVRDVEQVQAVLQIANQFKIPVWPISRGKNLTYGGAAPRMSGSVVLDMTRMNKILNVDPKLANCQLEPGVGFYDLYDYIKENELPLWMSVPVQAWGSVIGNALERGLGLSAYGDHSQQLCGLEVALASGDLIRTGFASDHNHGVWNSYKSGFGPGWEQMFCQSNFGVVTKAGMWLMPEPESTVTFRCGADNKEDLPALLDMLIPLRQRGVIDQYMSIVNWTLIAASIAPREPFYQGDGAMPDNVSVKIREHYKLGWWNFEIVLYGDKELVDAKSNIVEKALKSNAVVKFKKHQWLRGEPASLSSEPRPDVSAFQMVSWYGGRGGHMDFAPTLPADTEAIWEHVKKMSESFKRYDLDEVHALHIGPRHVIAIAPVLFNRDNDALTNRVKTFFDDVLDQSLNAGHPLYRSHLRYMDSNASAMKFSDNALQRLNEKVKDALDPNGILAPGKSGIWPSSYRGQRGKLE